MAIYYLDVKMVKRSEGKSAIGASAYRRATALYSEQEKKEFNYSNKEDVIHSELSAPEDSPEWVNELVQLHEFYPSEAAQSLWNSVEAIEVRKDAQYAREIKVALPKELTNEQNIALVREFIKNQFTCHGMIADWSVHADEGNPHAHILLTTRELTQDGFGHKVREWNLKNYVFRWREKWAEYTNLHLKQNQHEIRIDHRSYEAQGIGLLPLENQSQSAIEMSARGIPTESLQKSNYVRRENLRRIVSKPELALEMMALQSPSFTYEQLGQTMGRYINDKGSFSARGGEKGEKNDVLIENTLTHFDKISGDEIPQKVLTPEVIADIFKKIEQHEAVFSQDDLIKALAPYTDNAEIFAKAVIEIKASSELIYLGAGVDGRDRFTTRKMFSLENEIQQNADILNKQKHIEISSKQIKEILKSYQTKTGNELTEEQLNAVKHVLTPSSLSCIVGRAGTGKSFSLGAANSVWEAQGLRVLGVSLSGIASDGLSQGAGIKSQTLASFKYSIETGALKLDKNDVIVMDEAGMTDNDLMHFVLKEIKAVKAKLVLVGDPDQLQPIGAGAVFRALLERVGFAEIQTIYRQKEAWQKQATLDFAAGRTEEGLRAYEEKGCVHIEKDREGALRLLVNDWFNLRRETQKFLKEYMVIAHSNEDVGSLNSLIRNERIAKGEIAEGYDTVGHGGKLKVAKDDRLLFLKNNKALGIKNGRFATVSSVDFTETGRVLKINVVLDSSNGTGKSDSKDNAATEISIDPSQYHHFTHGYAATVHKVQGASLDHNFVYAGNGGFSWDRFLSYVAMTRHKISCHLYVNHEGGYGEFNLAKQMGKRRIKDSVMDYPLSFAERRGIDTSMLLKFLPQKLADRLKEFKSDVTERYEKITKVINPKAHQLKQDQLEKLNQHKSMAQEKAQRNEDARIIADYVDANREVGICYQSLKEKLNALGLDKISSFYSPEAFPIVSQTAEYKSLNEATERRNSIAASFVPNIERYSAAIEHYGLDHKKLNQHASAHEFRERVLNYHSNADKIVIKGRMALNIMDNIKAHYPYLNEFDLNTKDIRQDADNHLRRSFLSGLNAEERKAFDAVERYQQLSMEIGQCWAEKINKGASVVRRKELPATGKAENAKGVKEPKAANNAHLLERSDLLHFHALNQECEKLGYEILKNRDAHHKALNFFQIGLSAPHFHYDKTTEAIIKDNENKAQKRWYQLQQRAARHEIAIRVKNYQKALYLNDTPTRLQLAHEIIQAQKAHFCAIIHSHANTDGFRQALKRDAKAYEHQNFYNHLNESEKLSFKLVDEYVKVRGAYGSAWREIFESEKTTNLDENDKKSKKEIYSKLSVYTKPYKAKRNELAEKVLLNLPDKKILDYFKVDLSALYPQLNEHRLSEQVDQYHSETNTLKRGEIAQKMVEEPSVYSKHLFEKDISWKNVYRDVKCFERQKLFGTLAQEEKQFLRLVRRYQSLQQRSGKLWSKIYQEKESQRQRAKYKNGKRNKENKNQKFVVNDSLNQHNQKGHVKYTKVNALTSQRDVLAAQVLNLKQTLELYAVMESNIYTRNPSDLILQSEGKALAFDKLQKQAENHQKRLEIISQFKDVHERLQKTLSQNKDNKGEYSEINIDSVWWTSVQSEINQSLKLIKSSYSLYADALKQSQISQKTIENLEISMETISLSLKELSKINKNIPEKPILDPDQHTKILKAQRIAKGTLPIEGTLAERYLREHRGIQGRLPQSFRYHPAHYNHLAGKTLPALVVMARNEENQIQAVQIISLDPMTANKACGKQSKISYGTLSHAGVFVSHGKSDKPTIIAEGPETALSVAEAMPEHTVYAALGSSNFAHMPLNSEVKSVIFAADNDGKDAASVKQLERAANTLSLQGIDVRQAMPEGFKQDFNDVLKEKGVSEIQTLFKSPQMLQKAVDKAQLKKNMAESVREIAEAMTNTLKIKKEKSVKNLGELNQSKVSHRLNILGEGGDMLSTTKFIAERTGWLENFPEVAVHATVKERDNHPDYRAGKTGNEQAAFRLASDLISDEMLEKMKQLIGNNRSVVLPVTAIEREGINMIPRAMAEIIADKLNLDTERSIIQSNIVNHSRARAFYRMAFPATFAGEVKASKQYILVDDHVGLGGTLANLKGFIEKNGGSVILISTLSASHNSQYLVPMKEQINGLKQKHGEALGIFLNEELGHGINELTRAEAGQLLSAPNVDAIRDRIFTARAESRDQDLQHAFERKSQEEITRLEQAIPARTKNDQPAERNFDEKSTKEIAGNKAADDSLGKELEHQEVNVGVDERTATEKNQLEIAAAPEKALEKLSDLPEKNIENPITKSIEHNTTHNVGFNNKDYWKQISRESLSIKGTLAERYFENSGLEVKNYNSIRFHPEVWHKETKRYLPALIAKSIKVVGDSAAEKGIQIHYLDKETAKQPKIENPLRYFGEASDTVVVLQPPANKNDGRWIVALDINSALTVAQCKPDRLVSLMPSFKEIDKFPISDAGISVTLCADKDFPRQLLDQVIESFHQKNFKLSVVISSKDKSFSQLMREKGKSYVSEQIDRAKRIYSPEIVEVIDKFKEHEEKMLELKEMPSSYKSIEKKQMAAYLKQVNKDKKLVQQLTYQAPEIYLRVEKFMEKLKEIFIAR